MTGQEAQHTCVVMGDLVQSERAHAPDYLHATFNEVIDAHNRLYADILASPLTITLGQGITHRLSAAIPIIRELRVALMRKSIDCRFVIGQIELSTKLNPTKAWNMMGPGLARAREKLNEKKANTFYRFSLMKAPTCEKVLDALGFGLTAIEQNWTHQQRDDIHDLMTGRKPLELAQIRSVSVHTIYKVRASGNFDAYVAQWDAIQAALSAIDTENQTIGQEKEPH
jgi:SatD family (SatD)